MNNNYENINYNVVKENISQIISSLKKVSDSNLEQLISNDSNWQSSSKKKLTTAITNNKNSVKEVIGKLEIFSSVMDMVNQIQKLQEQEKLTSDVVSKEELNNKINQLSTEIDMKLGSI